MTTTNTTIKLINIGNEWRTHDDAYCITAHRKHTRFGKSCHYTIGRNRGLEWTSFDDIIGTDGAPMRFERLADARAHLATIISA